MKRVFISAAITGLILLVIAAAGFFLFMDTAPFSKTEFIRINAKFKAFRHTSLVSLDEGEVKTLYKWSCIGQCHGPDPIETSRHTSREWHDIVARMRDNGADVSFKEEEMIVAYLDKHFGSNVPTILSPEVNHYLKKYLWKSDFGESDLYVDLIYSPVEYYKVMGEILQMSRYDPEENYVFMVYLNTHQGKLEPYPLEELAVLRDTAGNEIKALDWQLLYKSGDMHHFEGVLRFPKGRSEKPGTMEVVLKDLPGQKERLFLWEMPVPAFKDIEAEPVKTGYNRAQEGS